MKSLCLVLGLLFLCHLSSAQDYIIENYHVDLKVDADGVMTIKEKIDVDFSEQRRGIIREIPLRYRVGDDRLNIQIDDIDVVGKNYKTSRSNGRLEIRIGNPDVFITGRQQYLITFKVQDAFLWLEDWTEFKWEVIGSEWDVPINNWGFTLEFSDDFDGALGGVIVNSGPSNHQNDAQDFTREDLEIYATSKKGLSLGEGIIIAVQISPDIIPKPVRVTREIRPTLSRDFTSPIAALFAGILLVWWQRSKKNRELIINPDQHYPPEGLSPAQCGAIEDPSQVHRNLISLIPYWGEKGFLSVRSLQKKYGFAKDDLYLEKLKDLPRTSPKYQTLVFDQIFETGDLVLLSTVGEKFSGHNASKSLSNYLKSELDIYDSEYSRVFKNPWMLALILISLLMIPFVLYFTGGILTSIFLVVIAILFAAMYFSRAKYSESGWSLKNKISAFKDFLKRDPDQITDGLAGEDSAYFEKVFPYAVAFGLDEEFANNFRELRIDAPIWFFDDHQKSNNDATTFADFREQFTSKRVASAFTRHVSDTSRSTGSSFSGSGSSGGFGGGGGSSW